MTVLILGGTAEARSLAHSLVQRGQPVVSSLAGRVSDPALPAGEVRIGGFGGPDGLASFLRDRQISAVIDATHPFAAQMSRHAALAAESTGLPLLRLARPGWRTHPRADSWTWVPDTAAAVAASAAGRPFLTTGRQSLRDFLPWADRDVLVRVVDPPTFELPERWRLLRSRGPYRYDDERRLLLEHGADVLVTKDSGGDYTRAKLDAAASLDVDVLVIARPPAEPGVASVSTVVAALAWIEELS
ncbi:MAG: cobalt-precorrin-6A reductase [Propionibacteriaceae bacterium]